ncbi:MAG: hypothetical protein HY767_04280, partial [Candidatus Omnitrophica bacterium]|nr:hypothetical protein [Candidatus Omnitrophota bacterium]
MPLVIEAFRSSRTPWEVFQKVHANSKTCFFLDSPQQASSEQAYSYIGMDPDLEIWLKGKDLSIEGTLSGKYPANKLFPILKKILKKYQDGTRSPQPFFAGGWVGYFGYETADLCDKIKFRAKPAPGLPRLYLGLFRNVIVY